MHIKLFSERVTRKMLSISVDRKDGGIMVVPHLQNWGVIISSRLLSMRPGNLLPDEASYIQTGGDNRPKLHYHRSGMSSVQPQGFAGGAGRKTIHLPALDELDAVQIFSVAARLPGMLPWENMEKPVDIIHTLDRPGVRSLGIHGVVYDRSKIDAESIGGANELEPLTFASDHNNAILVDFSGYGLESVLALYFNPTPRALPEWAADFTLASFDPAPNALTGGVAIHAGPGIPHTIIMQSIPEISTIHKVSSLRPVSALIERKLPSAN
ncbi:conserved hypothetical protein [Arthrobacter sp. 9V]|uniref:hypothetical protein n=1 Tax=Arthrobacter sp. 9V TaxID=2653132 RepID=UPI0012F38170|nr:hypothetical protein [Arthrobacter sp. 9V]VXC55172.1 conserved hypothetical protein [Arthrobacter sp. 9V]